MMKAVTERQTMRLMFTTSRRRGFSSRVHMVGSGAGGGLSSFFCSIPHSQQRTAINLDWVRMLETDESAEFKKEVIGTYDKMFSGTDGLKRGRGGATCSVMMCLSVGAFDAQLHWGHLLFRLHGVKPCEPRQTTHLVKKQTPNIHLRARDLD